jgi:hypothetical protein
LGPADRWQLFANRDGRGSSAVDAAGDHQIVWREAGELREEGRANDSAQSEGGQAKPAAEIFVTVRNLAIRQVWHVLNRNIMRFFQNDDGSVTGKILTVSGSGI